jgi:hypothetical protein
LSDLKGQALKDANQYIEGTNYVSKHTVERHFESKVHKNAMDFEKLEKQAGATTGSGSVASKSAAGHGLQPRIDTTMHNIARDAYEKLIKTAYFLAVDGQPLSTFKVKGRHR